MPSLSAHPASRQPAPLYIGPYALPHRALVAPMAGVTDRPYRQLCKRLGAGYAVSEMAASNPQLWHSVKTARRIDHAGEMEPKAVQIAGADPAMMAEAPASTWSAVRRSSTSTWLSGSRRSATCLPAPP